MITFIILIAGNCIQMALLHVISFSCIFFFYCCKKWLSSVIMYKTKYKSSYCCSSLKINYRHFFLQKKNSPQLYNLLYFSPSLPSLIFYGSSPPSFMMFCHTRISSIRNTKDIRLWDSSVLYVWDTGKRLWCINVNVLPSN